jgi:RNA-directed DNA polymerase
MSNTSFKTTVEWHMINWRKLERRVYKLQKRIYQASSRGDVKSVRRLQKTLMKSWSAKCLAVRKISQDNQGKKTAGVDGIKNLSPAARLTLVNKLKIGDKAQPTRRVWIPKSGTNEKRPLGISTISDRALQALVKIVLEPEWEAHFEPNSYGFRPGRSCHDAIEAIFKAIRQTPKFTLDADIASCFDKINQEKLLEKVNTFPTLRRQIRAWLKAGVMDGKELFPTVEGVSQGNVVSPLLANIALHGMEERVKEYANTLPLKGRVNRKVALMELSLIRYCDDFVIIHKDLTVIQECQKIISEWLDDMSLELKPSKTKIVHTLNLHEGQKPGFDFLGFNIRQYLVGHFQSKKGFKTIITPSKKKVNLHYQQLAKVIETHKAAPQKALIMKLNPMIRGWSNYYATACSKDTYSELDYKLFQKLKRWGVSRHHRKTTLWVMKKYWHSVEGSNWVFSSLKNGEVEAKLPRHSDKKITRFVKVKGKASPYDGNLVYWSKRLGRNPEMPKTIVTLLKKQEGKCLFCGLIFRETDRMEIDHTIPKSRGGRDEYKNLQLLHRHCHDTKSVNDKHQVIEEPDEVNTSRPVLKTSRVGDYPAEFNCGGLG